MLDRRTRRRLDRLGFDLKWICRNGHEWRVPLSRWQSEQGCPTCGEAVSLSPEKMRALEEIVEKEIRRIAADA